MRRTLALLLFFVPCVAHTQVWEKYVAPGLTYHMEYDADTPRTIHALHFDMHSTAVHAVPELGQLKVYNDDKTKGRGTVSHMVAQTNGIAGVNASFFPYTGRPVGLMVRNKELISTPYPTRAEFGWGGVATAFGLSSFSASFKPEGGNPIDISHFNDEVPADSICLDTDTGSLALTKSGVGTCAVIRVVNGNWGPNANVEGEVLFLYTDTNKVPIQAGNCALMGTGSKAQYIAALKPGQRVNFAVHTDGFNWGKIDQCVCGGPYLVKSGSISVDAAAEGFPKSFYENRYARTAIGRDSRGDIWLAVVDGKQSFSVGATLDEMAAIMKHLGCVDAINLDGGGSSTFNVFGLTMNHPSDGVERMLANAIVFYGPTAPAEQTQFSVRSPGTLKAGDKAQISVVKPDGEVVPNSEVLWASAGSGWIDQGGLLRVEKAGNITISASVHGQVVTFTTVVG
jgi:hypothetical protein